MPGFFHKGTFGIKKQFQVDKLAGVIIFSLIQVQPKKIIQIIQFR
jgi:hypothetical protein